MSISGIFPEKVTAYATPAMKLGGDVVLADPADVLGVQLARRRQVSRHEATLHADWRPPWNH
jgi:hypothetical protein